MLNFYKGFQKNKETKIVSNYVKVTDFDRINRILDQKSGLFNKMEQVVSKENQNIHKDRINALKNIKKD